MGAATQRVSRGFDRENTGARPQPVARSHKNSMPGQNRCPQLKGAMRGIGNEPMDTNREPRYPGDIIRSQRWEAHSLTPNGFEPPPIGKIDLPPHLRSCSYVPKPWKPPPVCYKNGTRVD